MCKRNGEYVDHLLLLSKVVCALWNAFFSAALGLSWVMSAVVWKMLLSCLSWREKNDRIFEDC